MVDRRVGSLGLDKLQRQPVPVDGDVLDPQADLLAFGQPVIVPAGGRLRTPRAAGIGEQDQRLVPDAGHATLLVDVIADGADLFGGEGLGLALGLAPVGRVALQEAFDAWVVGRAWQVLQAMHVANGGHGLIQGAGSPPPSVLGLRAVPCQVAGDGIRVGGQGRDIVLMAPRQEARRAGDDTLDKYCAPTTCARA